LSYTNTAVTSQGIKAPELYADSVQLYFYKGCGVGERHRSDYRAHDESLLKVATNLANYPRVEQGTNTV